MFWSRSLAARAHLHRYVDMWAFMGLHPSNIDLLQKLKQADDRQFTVNMDVCGTVSERNQKSGEWAQSHQVGIRTDIWNPDPEQQNRLLQRIQNERRDKLRREIRQTGSLTQAQQQNLERQLAHDPVMRLRPQDMENRRLVMKLFSSTSSRIRWVGTIEEVITREVHNSLGTNKPILSFVSLLPNYDYLTMIQENHRTFRIPSIYSFNYYDERHNRMWYLKIKRKWVSVGADYVIEAQDHRVGEIDGALIGLGYNAHVYIFEKSLSLNSRFADLLTLFATTVGYQTAMRRSLRRRLRAARKGLDVQNIIEDEEFRLLRNPRRVA